MKLLIIGDSHGNISNLNHVMGFGFNIGVGAVIHTGDWNNIESFNTVTSYGLPVYGVLGNADISPEIKQKLDDFLEFKLGGKKIAVIHKIHDIYKREYNEWDIIFSGHYHSSSQSTYKRHGNMYKVILPGALEKSVNFAIYDTESDKIEFIHD